MDNKDLRGRLAAALLGILCVWTVVSTWLAATRAIAVSTEFASYFVTPIATICAALYYALAQRQSKTWVCLLGRSAFATSAVLLVVFVWPFLLANRAFFHWKMKAIPADAWPQMVADLDHMGKLSMEADGTYGSFRSGTLPRSLRQLGLEQDYVGGSGEAVRYPDYSGIVAKVVFGYKPRTWGVWLGPERNLDAYCHGCKRIAVAPNAFFFVGVRG